MTKAVELISLDLCIYVYIYINKSASALRGVPDHGEGNQATCSFAAAGVVNHLGPSGWLVSSGLICRDPLLKNHYSEYLTLDVFIICYPLNFVYKRFSGRQALQSPGQEWRW